MNLDIVMLVISTIAAVTAFLAERDKSKAEIIKEVEEKAYQLFLYAEKQGWVGADKMAFVAKEFYKIEPAFLKKVLGEQAIEAYLQQLYDQFKFDIEKEIESNE